MKTSRPVKTIIEKWQLIIWIIMCLLGAGLVSLFSLAFPIKGFIVIIWLVASYCISRYLCRADTFFEFNNDTLIITRFCKILDISDEFQIYVNQIRGFEINEVTRGNRALILYFIDFKYLKLSLSKVDDEQIIQNFLRKKWSVTDSKSNPNYKTFGSAYWFAFKQCLLFMTISTTLCGIFIWQHKTLHLSTFQTGILVAIISIIVWIYTVNRPIKQNHFRFGAFYWFSNFMIYLSPLLLFPLHGLYVDHQQIPLKLKDPYQLFNTAPVVLYEFDNVNYSPKTITASDYFYGSTSGRGSTQYVSHYFVTPITGKQPIITNGTYVVWLAKRFTQTINKRADNDVKTSQALAYQKTGQEEFVGLFYKKPIFYKAMFNDSEAYQTVYKSTNKGKHNIVLEPHWESLSQYRTHLTYKILLFCALVLLANIIGCLIIAANR